MILYSLGVTLVDAVLGLLTRREHRHVERIPAAGAVVVVSNHLSVSDPLVLASALRRAGRRGTFLVMAEAFAWPVVGWLLRRTGQISVRRDRDPVTALQPALDALGKGWAVALYPEGRITTEPDYRPMAAARTGAVRLALAADCPIVPVAQWGAHRLLTREGTSSLARPPRLLGRLRPGRVARRPMVVVSVGEPITPTRLRGAVRDPEDLRAMTAVVMDEVRALLAEIAADELPDLRR
ncbi:lysophospholipid acyltransferase family protein [Phycicoccus duodecadis]|uniref:1-acyl-sn-glycerol-3-phosphate acyltransferase n=1 Tax=Phycicoccus duodecadis TaxID=173053 RepID=A0A2N3YF18_9MICO|nr:lysophospholipid acyltransferase family protein [Phycicoccus duodecadis]PKW25449.1 1-acyl-sn-glycerol-3-phosphate acyltransferase [Phycicoccus duodecadis]